MHFKACTKVLYLDLKQEILQNFSNTYDHLYVLSAYNGAFKFVQYNLECWDTRSWKMPMS